MATDATTKTPSVLARWSVVIVSLIVTATSFLFINGVAFLIPALETSRGTGLTEASLLSSMPSWGMVVTLVGWGYVLDRVGERIVMTVGSALTAAAAYAAASVHSMVWIGVYLFLGGMAAASCNGAGGRLVSGWFPPDQRGLAMGVRQTAQPLGIALGALVMPELAERGLHVGLMFPAVACAVAAVLSIVGVVDPPRKSRETATHDELASPYRVSSVLWRIHAVSSLLMMPQTVTVTFMLVWLIRNDGWSIAAAGGAMTVSQLLGALGRILVGRWSDRIGSRMQPVAFIAAVTAISPVHAGLCRSSGLAGRGRADDRRLGGRGTRQRVGGHRGHRIRRPLLERSRVGHPEHRPAPDGRRRSPDVRRADQRRQVPARVAAVRVVSTRGDAARASAPTAAGIGD